MLLPKAGLAGLALADPLASTPINAVDVVARAGWGVLTPEALVTRAGVNPVHVSGWTCPCAALPLRPTTSKSLTGVVTQGGGEVLDTHGAPIPGLYAGGNTIAGLSGDDPAGYLSGNGLLVAYSSGLIIGRHVAASIAG